MHDAHTVEPTFIGACEVGGGTAIAEHRAFAVRFDDDDDRSGATGARPDAIHSERGERADHAIAGVVGADVTDEAGPAAQARDDRGGVRRAPAAVPFDRGRDIGTANARAPGPHDDVLDEIADRADERFRFVCRHHGEPPEASYIVRSRCR